MVGSIMNTMMRRGCTIVPIPLSLLTTSIFEPRGIWKIPMGANLFLMIVRHGDEMLQQNRNIQLPNDRHVKIDNGLGDVGWLDEGVYNTLMKICDPATATTIQSLEVILARINQCVARENLVMTSDEILMIARHIVKRQRALQRGARLIYYRPTKRYFLCLLLVLMVCVIHLPSGILCFLLLCAWDGFSVPTLIVLKSILSIIRGRRQYHIATVKKAAKSMQPVADPVVEALLPSQ